MGFAPSVNIFLRIRHQKANKNALKATKLTSINSFKHPLYENKVNF